jgi:hypothetical protein
VSEHSWMRHALVVGIATAAVVISACGDSGGRVSSRNSSSGSSAVDGESRSGSDRVVARIGNVMVTRAEVNHWMSTLAGQLYFNLSHGHTSPDGLVSDPPAYTRCVSHLEAMAAAAPKRMPGVTGVLMLRKCHELHRALKVLATTRLVRVQWLIGLAGEQGVKVSDPEVLSFYRQSSREQYPSTAEAHRQLTAARTSVADELLVAKEKLLAHKLDQKIQAGGTRGQRRSNAAEKRWTAKTSCRPGYVIQYCSQFTGGEPSPTASSPPATVLIEQVATLATGRCISAAACARQ